MSPFHHIAPLATGIAAATLLCGISLLSADFVAADDTTKIEASGREPPAHTCSCPSAGPETPRHAPNRPPDKETLWPQPKVAELKPSFDSSDEVAALEAMQLALSEVGDGSSYVWHRTGGRLSGIVQPTTSFKGEAGRVCRHVVMMLTAGTYSKKAEGIACRGGDGIWSLEG